MNQIRIRRSREANRMLAYGLRLYVQIQKTEIADDVKPTDGAF